MLYWIIGVETLLLVGIGIFGYINLKRKQNAIEQVLKAMAQTEIFIQFIIQLYYKLRDTKETLDRVDSRGSFRVDDEVGFVFKAIKENVDEVFNFIKKYVNTEDKEDKEEEKKED